jgi:hypothetical protein
MTSQNRRAEPSPEARELLAHHDRLDLAEMVVAVHQLEGAARTELARLHEGEEPVTNPAVMHTPAQWIWQWNRAPLEKRLQVVEAAMRDGAAAHDCRINGHKERIHDGRHAEMALNEVRHVVADMEATTGARTWAGWLRDAMKRGPEHCLLCATEQKTEPASDPAATEAAIARVRSLAALWAKRTDQLKRASQLVTAALNDEPLALAGLAAPGPTATDEQDLARALGGDRTAEIIAHTLTTHGHTLNAVRTMTYAELLAIPGIGGPSLARIRAALDGVPEPVQCWHTEAGTPCDWNVCNQPERLAAGDYGTDPREQH